MFTIQNKREPSWILLERREYLLDTPNSPNPAGFHHVYISRDVTSDEETTLKKYKRCLTEELHEQNVPPGKVQLEPSLEIVASEDHDMLES